MKWFRRRADPEGPEELLARLVDDVSRNDSDDFKSMCERFGEAIVQFFPHWIGQADAAADSEAFGQTLFLIARYFEAAGNPRLMGTLEDLQEGDMVRWTRTFANARSLSAARKYGASTELLLPLLPEIRAAAPGEDVNFVRPRYFGLLAANYLNLEDGVHAREFWTAALEDCRSSGDSAGAAVYEANLRFLDFRDQLLEAQDLSDDCWYERSNRILTELLKMLDSGSSAQREGYRGKILGLLGLNCYRLNDREGARRYTTAAVDACRRVRDGFGVRVYLENLRAIGES